MWRMIGIAVLSTAMGLAIEYKLKQEGIIKPTSQPVRQSQHVPPPQYNPPVQQITYRRPEYEYIIIEEVYEVWE
jgi:hypothetical protein